MCATFACTVMMDRMRHLAESCCLAAFCALLGGIVRGSAVLDLAFVLCSLFRLTGLLLRNLNQITIIQISHYLQYIHLMVTYFKFLNSNPPLPSSHVSLTARFETSKFDP